MIIDGQYYGADTNPTGSDNNSIKYNKDYNLIGVVLYSASTPLDLKPMMIEVSYYEDIFNNFVSGEIMLTDSQSLIEVLNMHGNEYLRLTFAKDGNLNVKIDKLFRVYKVSNRQKNENGETETYVIHFVSDEIYMSEQYRISKSYKNKSITDIVNDILMNTIKVPSVKYNVNNIEKTKGTFNFVIPNLKPFETINWLSEYGKSKNSKSVGNDMLFFENAYGFNFYSLQTLFGFEPYYTYTYNPKNTSLEQNDNNANQKVFNILAYEMIDTFNTLDHVSNGTFANRVLSIDPLTQQYNINDFNYQTYANKANKLNPNLVVNNLQNRNGDALYETPQSMFKLAVSNFSHNSVDYIKSKPGSVVPNFFVEDILNQRNAQISLANYTRLKIYIAGDPNVTVGLTVNLDIKSGKPVGTDEEKESDRFYSGKYLITAVRHMIQMSGYHTVIELTKDSVPNSYANFNNLSSELEKLVKGEIII